MGFLKRLLGGDNPEPQETAAPRFEIRISGGSYKVPPPTGSGLDWRLPPPGSAHPNAPDGQDHEQGGPDRWNWTTPDGTVVLNAKVNNGIHAVRLEAPGGGERQSFLHSFIKNQDSAELEQTELRIDPDGPIGAYHDGQRLGTIPDDARPRLRGYLEDAQSRGWRTVTWTRIMPGNLSATMGRHPPSSVLIAEVRIPADDEPLFADSYDASFCFPWKQVTAWRKTPEGQAAYERFKASMPPPRQYFPIRIGSLELRATWNENDGSEDTFRGLEIMDPATSGWIRGAMPDELRSQGILITRVAGFEHHEGQRSQAFAPQQPLVLVHDPQNRYDRNAVGVWSADRRAMAGYLPREEAAWANDWARRTGQGFYAVVTTEMISRVTKQRTGMRILMAPQPILFSPT